MPTRLTPIWLQMAALAAATPLFAQQAAVERPPLAPQSQSGSAVEAGQRVGVDTQTGRLRGVSAEEARALVESLINSLNQSDAGLAPSVLPSGARIVNLNGRFEAAALAKMGPDGTAITECVTTKEDAERFLTETPRTPPVPTPAGPVLEDK